jgi:hypothetical protein
MFWEIFFAVALALIIGGAINRELDKYRKEQELTVGSKEFMRNCE